MNPPRYRLAGVIATGEVERWYQGVSLLVSAAADGEPCAALAGFRGLELMLDEDLGARARDSEETPGLSWAGRDTFARSLEELRDTALSLDALTVYACAASVETMTLTAGAVEERLAGVISTPSFLREAGDATLLFV